MKIVSPPYKKDRKIVFLAELELRCNSIGEFSSNLEFIKNKWGSIETFVSYMIFYHGKKGWSQNTINKSREDFDFFDANFEGSRFLRWVRGNVRKSQEGPDYLNNRDGNWYDSSPGEVAIRKALARNLPHATKKDIDELVPRVYQVFFAKFNSTETPDLSRATPKTQEQADEIFSNFDALHGDYSLGINDEREGEDGDIYDEFDISEEDLAQLEEWAADDLATFEQIMNSSIGDVIRDNGDKSFQGNDSGDFDDFDEEDFDELEF